MTAAHRYLRVMLYTVAFFVVGVVGSWLTNSQALLADALHFFGDGVPFFLGWWILRKRWEPRVAGHAEVVIMFFNSAFLGVVGIVMLVSGLLRTMEPVVIENSMLWFAVAEVVGNALQLYDAHKLKGAHYHHGTHYTQVAHLFVDLLSSASVLVSALLIYFTKFWEADGICTFMVGVLSLIAAWQCLILATAPRGQVVHGHFGHHH
ncbi:MAG: cation transporter [Patescibacteria group bacterium]|nr:cation transporter [Patescibacteria group bacterium]